MSEEKEKRIEGEKRKEMMMRFESEGEERIMEEEIEGMEVKGKEID